tara:strand:- start:5304 stop:10511 length:5208 start_codon:yes stop_codon:yes gene_type:complete
MANKKSIGLPGGPNQYLQDITQFISVDGYRNDSADKTNPVNLIPSGDISMKNVDFPILGTDNLGNSQMMFPENEYQFPGDMVMEVPQAQFGALGRVAKPFVKKGVKYLKSFFDDAASVTDDVVEEVVKKNPIAESVANTPKKLQRPPAEDYIFYRNTSNPETIMKPLDFNNPKVLPYTTMPENLSFFTPSNNAFRDYGSQKWGAKINPKKPFYDYKARNYDVDEVKKLMAEGYDAIVTNYGKSDIRDAYQVVTLDKSIITDLQRYKELGGESLPVAQFGALGRMVKPYAKKGVKYLQELFETNKKFTSEMDWGAFNKSIPENKILMQEYKLIEETTKANKTWMKNADGSSFAGTPEQFIQAKSGNFQKAFGNSKVQDIVIHKTDEVFDTFDPKQIGSRSDDGFWGKGFYFHPEDIAKKYDNYYGDISMPSYVNIANPYTGKQTMEVGKEFAKDIDGRVIMGKSGERGWVNAQSGPLRPVEYISTNPNNIKSAIGNNGMFDLKNPNIYKQNGGGTISQYNPPGFFENLADKLASPMTSFGYSARNENVPEGLNVNNPERNNFDSVIDMINPFAWAQYAENASNNVGKGEYLDATFDALGAIPIIPAWMSKGKNIKGPIKEAIKKVKEVIKPTDDMVEVFTSDGSKKLMKKTEAVRLNRIEDANVNNKTFTNYEDGNWFSDEIQPFYLNNAKNTLKGGILNPGDPKRVMSAYLDPKDAKLFDVSKKGTSTALDMSGGKGNLPIKGEYVLPPALVKTMREGTSGAGYNTMIGNSESIMQNLDSFYKKLGGGVYKMQKGGSWRDIDVDIEGVKKAISQAESIGGKLMKNKQSTASGLYGQRFSEIDKLDLYDGSRDEFIADLDAQNRIFEMRLNEGFVDKKGDTITTPLLKDAYDLTKEYKDQLGDSWNYSYEDIINLSNFIGRGGTRKYFGDVIRDGKSLETIFPKLYGEKRRKGTDGKPLENKTPKEYLEISREFYQVGGERLTSVQDNTRVATPNFERFMYDLDNPIVEPEEFKPFGSYTEFNPLETPIDNTYVDQDNTKISQSFIEYVRSENPTLSASEIESIIGTLTDESAAEVFDEYKDPVLISDFIKKSNYYAEGWKDMASATEQDVFDLQDVLTGKGYDIGQRGKDGIYGSRTYAAHRAMVDDNNLSPTSIGRYYKKFSKESYEEVKSIQEKLISEGYMSDVLTSGKGSSIDGKFGDQTKTALDAYNTDNTEEDTKGMVFNNIPSRLEEERCAAGMCTILEQNNVLTEAIGVKYKDAWDLFESMTNADNSKSIYNIYDSKLFDNVNESTSVEELKNITGKVKSKSQTKASDYKVGDIVGIYWQGSSHHKETLGSETFNTHSGFVSEIDEDGMPIVTHNVNGRVIQQPYNEISTAWIRRPSEDVEVRSQYEVNDDEVYTDDLAISNLERKYNSELSEDRKQVVGNILKRATYNSVKIPEILNSSVDPDWLKAATFGITGVESGVGLNAPRTLEDARDVNAGLQGLAYDLTDKNEKDISLGIGKTKFNSLDKFARQYFDITSPSDLADDNKAVDAVSYILTKNYELFKDYAKQYPQLGLTEIDIRNMSILSYNQGSNRLINTGRVDDERTSEEELAALRELYEGTSPDVSSTKYRFGNNVIDGLGDAVYNAALAVGLEQPGEQYISKVNGYIEDVFPQTFALNNANPFEVTTMAAGGEYGVFKNFINGDYDGTSRERYARDLHDKLNRKHYMQAKSLGMSPSNYIMTNVIGNS